MVAFIQSKYIVYGEMESRYYKYSACCISLSLFSPMCIHQKCTFSPATGSVFGHKDSPAGVVGSLSTPNHHDPWNRLHAGPSGFPSGPSWAKGADKRDERDRVKDGERREILHIKDEKDR